jgi:hypothetical protein
VPGSFVVRFLGGGSPLGAAPWYPGRGHLHAVNHAITIDEAGDDPVRWLVLGPDRAGNLLELVVIDRPDGPAVIHAMPMRAQYRRLLPKGRREQE